MILYVNDAQSEANNEANILKGIKSLLYFDFIAGFPTPRHGNCHRVT